MRKLLLMACALFGFMSCTQNPIEEQSAIHTDAPETIRVGFEDNETRIQLNEAQKTVWTKGDLVSVFYRSDANQKWQYQGETGERVGDLKRVENATSTTKTTKTVVVYPYSESYWLNTDTFAIDATLPATQYYTKGSYGVGSNLMVSQSEFTQFSLKSVCGWLKLQLTGDGEVVKSIKFRGNDGEQVAGLIYVDTATAEATLASEMGGTDDNNAGGNLVFDDTILTEVVLDCGDGVTLGKSATAFYIALPPQTFANGFTVDIECEDYELMTLTTEKEFVIERNHIQPMASVEHNAEQIIPNNEIWYTNGSTTEATTPYETNVFGANIVSNTYDAAKECWVIKFDGDVTMIGDNAFYYCFRLTSVTIPDSVTMIGYDAFYSCSSLTSVTIPDSVTTIGDEAFAGCSSLQEFNGKFASEDGRCLIINGTLSSFAPAGLTEYTIPDSVTSIGDGAFCMCSGLTSVTIGNNVTTIGDDAFSGCISLTSVTIGDSVTSIGVRAFQSCISIQEFKGKFASKNGRCLIVDGTLISFAPAGLTEYTIPDSVTTIGYLAFEGCSSLTSVTIPDSVTTIGVYAFSGCISLTSVTIPDSVTSIGECAFSGCSSLTSVTIPDNVTTIEYAVFAYCDCLTSVYCKATTPPVALISWDYWYAFLGNAPNRKIYVPMESVEAYKSAQGWSEYASDIVGYDFENGVAVTPKPANNEIWYTNGSTTEATTPNKTNAFGANIVSNTYDATKECWVIKFDSEVTSIGNYAFEDCSSLTSVTIPDSVTSIGYYAFYECNSLQEFKGKFASEDGRCLISDGVLNSFAIGCGATEYTIPDSVTTIGDYAFGYCSSLTSVTIPDSVTMIEWGAFCDCSSLTSVTIPDSVTEIGNSAFDSCSSLTSVTIPDSVTIIGYTAFAYCRSLTSVTIPDSVTTIGNYVFQGCSSLQEFKGKFASKDGRCLIIDGTLDSFAPVGLTEYTIPDSVTTIGDWAFYDCYKLTSVTIPDSVTTIGSRAFCMCSGLTSVTIGNNVTTIGNYTFCGCSSLTSVYCKPTTPPAALSFYGDWEAFDYNASGRKIYVPMESVEAYKSASGWSSYSYYIEGYNF